MHVAGTHTQIPVAVAVAVATYRNMISHLVTRDTSIILILMLVHHRIIMNGAQRSHTRTLCIRKQSRVFVIDWEHKRLCIYSRDGFNKMNLNDLTVQTVMCVCVTTALCYDRITNIYWPSQTVCNVIGERPLCMWVYGAWIYCDIEFPYSHWNPKYCLNRKFVLFNSNWRLNGIQLIQYFEMFWL